MCSRYFEKRERVISLKIMCMDMLIQNMDIYNEALIYLPVNIKNRILKRLSNVPYKFSNIQHLYKSLLHQQVDNINFGRIENIDNEFLNMITICKNLRHLTLTQGNAESFTTQAIVNLLPNFKYLNSFVAANSSAITDEVTAILVLNCKQITQIDFSGCNNITDLSLEEISKLEHLNALKISRTKISTEGIIKLSTGRSNHRLKELYIDQCNNVTNEAIHSLCENCTSVEVLIFNNCSQIDGQSCINEENNTWKNLKHLTWTVYW